MTSFELPVHTARRSEPPSAAIVVSGADSAFPKSEPLLKILAEGLSFLGEKVGAASALDCAFLSYFAGALLGALHGARICEAEVLRVDEFGSLIADTAPLLGADIKHMGEAIQESKYENPQAALQGWAAGPPTNRAASTPRPDQLRLSELCLRALREGCCRRLRNGGSCVPHQSAARGRLTDDGADWLQLGSLSQGSLRRRLIAKPLDTPRRAVHALPLAHCQTRSEHFQLRASGPRSTGPSRSA